jgi:hypothetical protein
MPIKNAMAAVGPVHALISSDANPMTRRNSGVNKMKCATTATSRKFASAKRKVRRTQDCELRVTG